MALGTHIFTCWLGGFPMVPMLVVDGNCNIVYFTFRHCQVQNFEILKQSERDWNFVVNFLKNQKQKQKLNKYIKTEQKWSILPWNFIKFC